MRTPSLTTASADAAALMAGTCGSPAEAAAQIVATQCWRRWMVGVPRKPHEVDTAATDRMHYHFGS